MADQVDLDAGKLAEKQAKRAEVKAFGKQMVTDHTAVNKQAVAINELENRLRNIFEQRKDKTMFIVGEGSLRYGEIVQVIDAARGAGVEKVGIVTEGMRRAAGAAPSGN